jgi:hypothetical protein
MILKIERTARPTRKEPNCTILRDICSAFLPCQSGYLVIPCTFRRKSGTNGAALGNYLLPSDQNELLISFFIFPFVLLIQLINSFTLSCCMTLQ